MSRFLTRASVILLLLTLTSCSFAAGSQSEVQTEPFSAEQSTERDDSDTAMQTDESDTAKQTGESGTQNSDTAIYKEATLPVTVSGTAQLDEYRTAVYGTCEPGCVISVRGEDIKPFSVMSDGENFVFEVKLPKVDKSYIYISAQTEGKAPSAEVSQRVRYLKGAEDTGVIVTVGSTMVEEKVLSDLYKTDPFTSREMKNIAGLAQKRLKNVRNVTDKDTELIYVIVPNPLTVQPELWTEDMKSNIQSGKSRLDQAVQALSGLDGITVIDLSDALTENRSSGKLYYSLDSHWTELGAYFGYREIMEHIGKEFPAALPHPLTDYDIAYIPISDTDMTVYSGIGEGKIFEAAPFLHPEYTPLTKYDKAKDESARIWNYVNKFFTGTSVTYIDNKELPTGVLLMDSYGLNTVAFLAEHFSCLAVQPVWKYQLDYSLCRDVAPDYVIQIISERTVGELLVSE